jgi:sulfhydrogenase subunit beta (sulfur reductase)
MNLGESVRLSKRALLNHLAEWLKKSRVIGPCAMADGEVTFRPLHSIDEITFDYVNDFNPLKRFLTPAWEELFVFSQEKEVPVLSRREQIEPQILFGIRSCDVQGIRHSDKFFGGAYLDTPYWERRNSTTIISMACNKPMDTCFCICCDGGPSLTAGFDVQLTDLGDFFLADIGSEKGIAFLQGLDLERATLDDLNRRHTLMQACDEQMVPTAYLAKAVIAITNNRVDESLWEQMGAECFSCGGCTHVCPCCTCFDVNDGFYGDGTAVRFRCWDSCQYSGFTREASGHNPRAKTKERVKRRFYHKLSYAYIHQDGHPGCVGCGRCITVCEAFGLLDIAAVVKRLRRDGQLLIEKESKHDG